ncbi:FecR domain-containing protein [Chitinophaga oryzae]|uniref:FecR domain-containing protein n=1 Tax=Chitinophaga oryzae TaxID=2725414 RepID=A0AAE6ZGD2_9BACT|nr:FecR family protein [Chitinophaga oryzae]QJB32570.1 FecR domain-containing protein [Chitinophaga oryzae]
MHRLLEQQSGEFAPGEGMNEEERLLLKELLEIRNMTGDMKGWEGVNTAEDLVKLKTKLSLPSLQPAIVPMWQRVLRYAAAIALPLAVIGVTMWTLKRFNSKGDLHANQYVTIDVPDNETRQLTMPDGSNVWLNAGSRLRYPATFSATERTVEMNGEACFSVVANDRQPFLVKVNKQTIRVLGTLFNVNAYGQNIQTTLLEGKIAVSVTGQSASPQYLLPGQQSVYDTLTGQLQVTTGNPSVDTAWKAGQIAFSNVLFPDLMHQLGHLYNYKIIFATTKFDHLHYNIPVMDKPAHVTRLLELVKATTTADINFKVDTVKRTIEIN